VQSLESIVLKETDSETERVFSPLFCSKKPKSTVVPISLRVHHR
jgi:hypothetical protein